MKVQKIQPQSFEAKQRFLNESQKFNLKMLLGRMTSESTAEIGEYRFTSNMLQCVKIGKKSQFFDERFLAQPSYKMVGRSTLKMGRTSLTFDNKTGEIIDYKKPFYSLWSRVIKKAEEVMQLANDNFNNKKVVEKRFISIEGFTSKGAELMQAAMGKKNKAGKKVKNK